MSGDANTLEVAFARGNEYKYSQKDSEENYALWIFRFRSLLGLVNITKPPRWCSYPGENSLISFSYCCFEIRILSGKLE